MYWQYGLVGLLVCLAVVYLTHQTWQTWKGRKAGCGGGCSCPSSSTTENASADKPTWIPSGQLTLRPLRTGEGVTRNGSHPSTR